MYIWRVVFITRFKSLSCAMLMIIALTSCTKCPKAIRSEKECQSNSQASMSQSVTVGEPTMTTTTVGVTIPQFAKNHTTTNTTTITDAIATKMNTTTTQMMSTLTDSIIESIVYPTETEVVVKTEPIIVEPITKTEPLSGYWDNTTDAFSTTYLGEWEGVWYTATDMNYNYQPYGASGNQLISGYSVACDNLPFGTRLLIECDYFTKEVRGDDCGVGYENILDFYYFERSEIPSELLQRGRIPITVSIIN